MAPLQFRRAPIVIGAAAGLTCLISLVGDASSPLRSDRVSIQSVSAAPGNLEQLDIFPGHPRLIVGGYRGLSVQQLSRACASPDMQGECANIAGGSLSDAMLYLLNGDLAAAGRVKLTLLSSINCIAGNEVEHADAGGSALAYDWIADTMSPAEAERIESGLAACGSRIAETLRTDGPHLWHGFTSLASALALIALAVDRPPERAALLADAQELFRGRALEAYAVVGGAWPEGYNYERSHFFSSDPPGQYVLDAIRAWDSAVARDHVRHESIVDTIAMEEGDWLSALAYHVVYGTVPAYGESGKPTLMRGGDMPTGQAYPNKQIRPFVDAIALITRDPALKAWGESLEDYWSFVGGEGTYHSIHRYALPLDLPTEVEAADPQEVPPARVWAPDDMGYVIARSGWATDASIVGYRAGKWFTGHQHMDQGHLDLWRKGPLAVDAGVYANWGSPHRELYYMRTVAHNSPLIHRDGEIFDQFPSVRPAVNDDGQRVHTYRGCPQCMQSVDEWRSNLDAGLHLEAAVLEDFYADAGVMALASDLTGAYNSTRYASPGNVAKVESVQRDIVFRQPDLVLVTDRVRVANGTQPPRFVLHLPTRPSEPYGEIVAGTRDDGILSAPAGRFVMDNGSGGRLVGRTLVPGDARLQLIGGPNYRYWADGANQVGGDRGLEGSPAEPGTWRVEVEPPADGPDHLLVHALTVTDSGRDEIPSRILPLSDAPVGAEVLALAFGDPIDTVILTSANVPRGPVTFARLGGLTTAPGGVLVVVTGLRDGESVFASSGGEPVGGQASGGSWSARVAAGTGLDVGTCPAPDDAAEAWRQLCRPAPIFLPIARAR